MLHSTIFLLLTLSSDRPAAPRLKAETTKQEATTKRFDFEDDLVIGEGSGPLYETITKRPNTKFGSLIPIRENFDQELMKSVYDL